MSATRSALRKSVTACAWIALAAFFSPGPAVGRITPGSPAPTTAESGSYRIASVRFYGYLVPDINNVVTPSDMPSPIDVNSALRANMVKNSGVQQAIAILYAQPPIPGTETNALDALQKILAEGPRDAPGGLNGALKSEAPPDSSCAVSAAYPIDESTGQHIKWGWVTYSSPTTPSQPLQSAINIPYRGQPTAFKTYVGVAITVEAVSW